MSKQLEPIDKEEPVCCICFDRPPDATFYPCAHTEFCFCCTRDLTKCPLCRTEGYSKPNIPEEKEEDLNDSKSISSIEEEPGEGFYITLNYEPEKRCKVSGKRNNSFKYKISVVENNELD